MRLGILLAALVACDPPGPGKDPVDDTDRVDDTDPTDDTDPVDDTDPTDDTDLVDDTDPADDTDPVDDTDDSDPADTDPPVDTSGGRPWAHTITVDGDPSDWLPAERRPTGAGAGTDFWFTWDDDDVCVALRHPDVGAGGPLHWVVFTFGAAPGTTDGVPLGQQQPDMAFEATHLLQWKADDSFSRFMTWDGATWQSDTAWRTTLPGRLAESNPQQTVEACVPRSALGDPRWLRLHAHMVYEGAGFESSFAASPPASFADGAFDPTLTAWYGADLTTSPAGATVLTSPTDTFDTGDRPDSGDSDVDSGESDLDTGDSDVDTDDSDVDSDDSDDSDVDTDDSADIDSAADTAAPPWAHTITIDGRPDDWLPEERFVTSDGYDAYITWDDVDVFVALTHPDVNLGTDEHWWSVTFGGAGGASLGATLGNQTPGLVTPSTHQLQWKADDSYSRLATWDGAAWIGDDQWRATTGGALAERNDRQTVELRLPRSLVAPSGVLTVHLNLVFEGAGFESSYAAAPGFSFQDGAFDPDYGAFYTFDLDAGTPATPGVIPPLPDDTGVADTADTAADDTDPADSDPVDSDTDDSDPVDSDTAPVDTDPVDTDPVDTDPVDTDTARVDTDTARVDTADTDVTPPWAHTVIVDGDPGDYFLAERLTTASGTDAWVTWDADDVFVAIAHPDVALASNLHWVVFTFAGTSGANEGSTLGTQTPGLALPGLVQVQWKVDNSYDKLVSWSGGWNDAGDWRAQTGGALAERNDLQTVELRLPRSLVAADGTLRLHVNLVYEGAGFESSYAAMPAASFADGTYDPDYARFLVVDLVTGAPGGWVVAP